MAGGQALGADLARHTQERLKLYVCIAVGAGDGRASSEILIHKRAHDARLELFFEVHDVMREIQMPRDSLRVINIVQRTATMLRGAIALQFRQAPLVPELHGESNHATVLLLKERSDSGGIDATGHGYSDEAALCFGALGQSLEFNGGSHEHNFIVTDSVCQHGRKKQRRRPNAEVLRTQRPRREEKVKKDNQSWAAAFW